MSHIFLANNSFTVEAAKLISKKIPESEKTLVIVNTRLNPSLADWAGEVINPPFNKSNSRIRNFLSDFKRSSYIYNEIAKKISKETDASEFNIYIPNIHHSLTNAVFYSIRKKSPAANIKFHILVEGSLNFTAHKITFRYLPIMLAKKFISLAHGIPYTIFVGSFCGDDQSDFSSIYSPSEIGLNHSKLPIKKLDFISTPSDPKSKKNTGILILGQYLEEQLGKRKNKIIIDSFVDWIKSNHPTEKIYYKGHPLHPDETLESALMACNVEFLDPLPPLEQIITSGCYKKIISISSSGLMMSKIIMQERIECTAYGLDFLDKHTKIDYSKIKKTYSNLGINCVEIDSAP